MKIEQNNQVICDRGGGTGALRTIPYTAYLYKCNDIFLRVAALLLLELTISYSPFSEEDELVRNRKIEREQ
jgi:hypothetical protein